MIRPIFCFADSELEWNCSQWRALTPSNAQNRKPDEWKSKLIHWSGFISYLNPAIQDLVAPADLIIFQRNIICQEALDAMSYWQGMGKPVVIDLDDAYQMLPWCNPAHRFWHEKDEGAALKVLEQGMYQSDGLISPNHLLLKDWEYATRGYYLQNYAEKAWWDSLPSRGELRKGRGLENKIVIGWGGSVSHYDSWWGSGIFEAAERVSKRHPEVLWLACGNDPRIFERLPVSSSQKAMQPGVSPDQWPKVVKMFDIGVAPLFGPYDQRRSWIKGIEYMLAGVPWIGTGGEVYGMFGDLGTLIDNSVKNWEDALETKILNIKSEQERAENLIPYAQQSFIVDNQLNVFADVYNKIKRDFNDEKGHLPNVWYIRPANVPAQ